MRWQHTDHSKQDYDAASSAIRKAFDKQAALLAANPDFSPVIRGCRVGMSNV
jgi:hypothetical protein